MMAMSEMVPPRFHALDELLRGMKSPHDYWEDEGILQAIKLLQDFDSSEWQQLCATWSIRSEDWQTKLAQALGHGPSHQAARIALLMAASDRPDVRMAALGSLRDMNLSALPPAELYALNRRVTHEIAYRDSALEFMVLHDLAARIREYLKSLE
jgi:hypothetical protein